MEAKHKTNESIGQLAERFGVSYSFISRLLKRYEATVSVEPNPHGGGKPPLLNAQQIEILEQLVQEDNDATLQELSVRLTKTIGVKASLATICRVLQRLELTRKKDSTR
ncbi:helix-turn-helix domain-containing protein [Gloeocapsopsis crepidinum]|uniref:helix-turn-helix domain-containing protein n=1 Tax=Gloeocapsopsis crepidinum TaxID=693223 RepID=UPI003898D8D4